MNWEEKCFRAMESIKNQHDMKTILQNSAINGQGLTLESTDAKRTSKAAACC